MATVWVWEPQGERRARTYTGSLGAEPPVGSGATDPGKGSCP